jgi:hypothetical protein
MALLARGREIAAIFCCTLTGVFQTVSIALVAFDAYMDFRYGSLASGFWGQVGFAAMTSFIVMFFGIVGLRFIEHAFHEWHR